MMLNHTASAASSPRLHERTVLTAWLRAVASALEATHPVAHTRTLHLWVLAAIMSGAAVVRFWGLGAVGLHGDEETMAMAVRHILIDGRPLLPGGMFYPRGLSQLYLMTLSVLTFGESEWALRLPSAICGVALVGVAYAAGRRFLRPTWNLAFAASMAFLPMLIVDSQTARMYIFLVLCITACLACLFTWEKTGRTRWLIGAAAMLVLGLDMHALALGVALVLLAPGVLHDDVRRLRAGVIAAICVFVAYFVLHGWVNAQYPAPPPEFVDALGPPAPDRSLVVRDFNLAFDVSLWTAGLVIAFLALHAAHTVTARWGSIAVAACALGGIVLQLSLYYHLAAICYAASIAIALRAGSRETTRRVVLMAIGILVLFVVHAALLAASSGAFIRLVGALVGQPSVWPYARIAQISPAAGIATAALLIWGVHSLVRRRRAPDFWLLAVLGVWAPVFALGAFAWNVPSRYTEMALAPMLLCAFAAFQYAWDSWSRRLMHLRRASAVAAGVAALCVINPIEVAATVNAGYRIHPDHKGAAEFVRSQGVVEADIVLAEDVLQQTYYLGRVDYWLIGPRVARRYVKRTEDAVVDFYTGTPVIVTTAMLDQVLRENRDKRVFVIGTGEGWRGGRRRVRGELESAINSDRFRTVYVGRDGLTRVLTAAPDAAASARERESQ